MSEELRVLYVAMTRAKEKMIMVTSLKNTSRTIEKLSINLYGKHINPISVRNSASYSDMILLSVLRYPGQDVLRSPFNYTAVKYDENDVSPLEVEIIDADTLEYEEEKTVEEKVQPDKKLVEEIAEKSQYIYPYSDLSGIPAKRSASQVNGNGISRDFFASSRPAFMDENGLTPAQKGTAMHLFMQHSDYHNARNDVESEIARLTSEGFISTQQSESLDRQKLKGFFTSSVAERMLSSNRVYREKKFIINMSVCEFDNNLPEKFENERVVVQGILDCAFEEDGKIVIVDYKTDRVSSKQQLAERYRPQLDVYKKAVRECLGYEIKQTVLYSFYLGKEVVL